MHRRYDIDWLRIVATLLLFVFHGGMIFSPAPFYHVRNADLSMTLMVLTGFISLWHMPLFFLIAGWSLYGSLARRGAGGVFRERLRRLGVPLVVGCLLFMPIIKYLELSSGLDLNYAGLRVAQRWGLKENENEGLKLNEALQPAIQAGGYRSSQRSCQR